MIKFIIQNILFIYIKVKLFYIIIRKLRKLNFIVKRFKLKPTGRKSKIIKKIMYDQIRSLFLTKTALGNYEACVLFFDVTI